MSSVGNSYTIGSKKGNENILPGMQYIRMKPGNIHICSNALKKTDGREAARIPMAWTPVMVPIL